MASLFVCVLVAGGRLFGLVAQRVVIVSPSKHRYLFGFGRRLHRPEEFSTVFSSRLMIRGGHDVPFVLHYRLLNSGNPSRLGLVVPKRYAKAAAVRNAIKRQGREAFRLMADRLPPCDLVLRLNRSLGDARSSDPLKHKEWRIMMDALLRRVAITPSAQ